MLFFPKPRFNYLRSLLYLITDTGDDGFGNHQVCVRRCVNAHGGRIVFNGSGAVCPSIRSLNANTALFLRNCIGIGKCKAAVICSETAVAFNGMDPLMTGTVRKDDCFSMHGCVRIFMWRADVRFPMFSDFWTAGHGVRGSGHVVYSHSGKTGVISSAGTGAVICTEAWRTV